MLSVRIWILLNGVNYLGIVGRRTIEWCYSQRCQIVVKLNIVKFKYRSWPVSTHLVLPPACWFWRGSRKGRTHETCASSKRDLCLSWKENRCGGSVFAGFGERGNFPTPRFLNGENFARSRENVLERTHDMFANKTNLSDVLSKNKKFGPRSPTWMG